MVKPKPKKRIMSATLQKQTSGPKGRRKNAPGVGGSSETPPRAFYVCWAPFCQSTRDVFTSLGIAWTLLRIFPQELLKKIPQRVKDAFYDGESEVQAAAQTLKWPPGAS